MAMELIYTSAKNGLKPGSVGFCTVAMSRNMPAGLAAALESLSGYRHIFAAGDNRYAENPVSFGHLLLPDRSRLLRVLLRIGSAPADYTGRTNKLAHFVVLDPGEYASAGPAWLLQQPGLMRDAWTGEPRWLEQPPTIPMGSSVPARCMAWQRVTGDAGWAGELLTRFTDRPDDPVHLVCNSGTPMLDLFTEALALLPPQSRWQIAFSTYFTGLAAAGAKCHWRAVMAGPGETRLDPKSVINLTQPLGRAPDGPAYQAARTGTMMAPTAPVIAEAPIMLVDTSGRSAPRGPAVAARPSANLGGVYDLKPALPESSADQPWAGDQVPGPRKNRWLWPAIFGAAALLVLVVFLAIFFVKEIRSMRRQTREQRRVLAVSNPSTPAKSKLPAAPAVSKSPAGRQKAPKKNNSAPRPEKKPTPIKPGLTANGIAAPEAKTRVAKAKAAAAAKAKAAKVKAAKAKELAAERAAESHMQQEPITILNHPIVGASASGGLALPPDGSKKEADKIATVEKVKAFMVVFSPKIKGGTLSLLAADKKTKWKANQWYPAKAANLAIKWRPSSSAGLGGAAPVPVAKITISAAGALTVSCAPDYFGQHRAKRRAVEGMVVDVLRKGNKIERLQFLQNGPREAAGVDNLGKELSRVCFLGRNTAGFRGWHYQPPSPTAGLPEAVIVLESITPTAALNLALGRPRRSVAAKLPAIRWSKPRKHWDRVTKDLTTALSDAPRLQKPPPPVQVLKPLRLTLVKTGLDNNYAGLLKKLDALAAPSEPWLSQIQSWLADPQYCITNSQLQDLKGLKKKGSKKNTAKLKKLEALKQLTSDLRKLETDYQARTQKIKACLAALESLKEIRLRVELYPGGPVLLQVTYRKKK